MKSILRAARAEELTPIISKLERALDQLDLIGTTIAAAHLDAAIHQLRRDQAQIANRL